MKDDEMDDDEPSNKIHVNYVKCLDIHEKCYSEYDWTSCGYSSIEYDGVIFCKNSGLLKKILNKAAITAISNL